MAKVPKNKPETTGQRIADERKTKGITQEELGAILNLRRGVVNYYERDARTPSANIIFEMAKYFRVSSDYLLCLSEYRNQAEIDSLMKKLDELDGLTVEQKSSLLWSLGFVSERLKNINDDKLKWDIISWLAGLIQSYGHMIYLPAKLKLDHMILASVTSPHRDAIHILNELDAAIMDEIIKLIPLKNNKDGEPDGERNTD